MSNLSLFSVKQSQTRFVVSSPELFPEHTLCAVAAMTVGVLALQGSFNEHIAALKRLGVVGVEVRKAEQLQNVSALIIPGGESTTMAKLAGYHNLFPALREFVKMGKPVWGTCAGLIFLADKAIGQKSGGQELIGGLDCTVHRNFFGSQLQSFESEVSVPDIAAIEGGPPSFRGVFIRAPGILEVGPEVQVLAEVAIQSDGTANFDSVVESSEENSGSEKKVIVAVKQGNLLATAFHPELTADIRWHSYFLKMVKETSDEASSSTASATKIISLLPGPPKYDLPIYQQ
ncbi:putative pyridoxal 5'-phosphate synthase subunit PDX2 [Primulina tabacum]|uniref:putative pyridoxal 5'-phosphate synthase subunit PDX2 n=1 Tax=Primulina tabacum TaxID=48773 RepID=UPI003F5AC0C1